jgi:hypothetical protein
VEGFDHTRNIIEMRLIDISLVNRIDLFLIKNKIPERFIAFMLLMAKELELSKEEIINWLENHSETEWKSVYSLIKLCK